MTISQRPDVDRVLTVVRGEAGISSSEGLFAEVHGDLRRIAQHVITNEAPDETLLATELVHDAFVKLMEGATASWEDRRHFINTCALAMRHLLRDRARRRRRARHGGGRVRVELKDLQHPRLTSLPDPIVDRLMDALDRLDEAHPQCSEVARLRFVVGLTVDQTSTAMGISTTRVKKHWAFARAWLWREINAE